MSIFLLLILIEFIVIIVLPFALMGLGMATTEMRKAPSAAQAKPEKLTSIVTSLPSDEVMKVIIRFAQQTIRYEIDLIDQAHGYIVLSSPTTFPNWGFFYPIYLTQQASDSTLVEVGTRSKLLTGGPTPSRHHKRCAAGIFAAIFAHS